MKAEACAITSGVRRPSAELFGLWVWVVVGLICATSAGVVWFQARQSARLESDYAGIRLLRQSRLDLTKGFLHVAQSDGSDAPFSREQGLALIDQAVERLRGGFEAGEASALASLLAAAEVLRARVRERPEGGGVNGGQLAELRARFGVLEREADAADVRLREQLARSMLAQRHGFLGVAAGAVAIVGVACGALLLLRRRGRRAQDEVRELAERFAAVVEHLPAGLILTGCDGGGLQMNPAARALLEKAGAGDLERIEYTDAEGRPVAPDELPLARVARGESVRELELRARPVGGGPERRLSFSGGRVAGIGGGPFAFVAVRDVTRRRRDEEELRTLNAELERRVAERTAALEAKNRELETFTYSVSHDLKAPLRGIDGYSRLLLDEHAGSLNEEGRQFLGRVRQASAHMGQLIDDLLTYSRLERRTLRLGSVALAKVVREQLAVYGQEIARRAVTVELRVAEELEVQADPQGLAMVVRNLMDNSFKFTRERIEPRIEIGAHLREDGVILAWVRDNGVGFDGRYAERMFEIFQRLHRAEDYPGTGVGLAIVRKAMERMGGRVWSEGAEGRGATVHLEFAAGNCGYRV